MLFFYTHFKEQSVKSIKFTKALRCNLTDHKCQGTPYILTYSFCLLITSYKGISVCFIKITNVYTLRSMAGVEHVHRARLSKRQPHNFNEVSNLIHYKTPSTLQIDFL